MVFAFGFRFAPADQIQIVVLIQLRNPSTTLIIKKMSVFHFDVKQQSSCLATIHYTEHTKFAKFNFQIKLILRL